MTIGDGQQFPYVVVHFPQASQRVTPGQVLVAFTRAIAPENFALGNTDITQKDLKNIGKGAGYQKRRVFEEQMNTRASESETLIREQITELDTTGNEVKTFEGGCQHLLRWYRGRVADLRSSTNDRSEGDSSSCSSSPSSGRGSRVDTHSDCASSDGDSISCSSSASKCSSIPVDPASDCSSSDGDSSSCNSSASKCSSIRVDTDSDCSSSDGDSTSCSSSASNDSSIRAYNQNLMRN